MRQIVAAIKYLHIQNIIHRDLKLDNIMVNFDNELDTINLNMMKAKIKIIDFGFAIHLSKSSLAFSALGSPINMDPIILKKLTKKGGNLNQLGYDIKADIWSLGTICYEMLMGKAVFNAETMNDLIKKVEIGSYSVPASVSSEMISFLNGMLQYEGVNRLSAEELSKHPFLTKSINDFTKFNSRKISKKESDNSLNINDKTNKTIWEIFNGEDERQLINIRGDRDLPSPEGPIGIENSKKKYKKSKTSKSLNTIINNNPQHHSKKFHKSNTNLIQYPTLNSQGLNISPNIYGINQIQDVQQIPQKQMSPIMLPIGEIQQMRGISNNPIMNYPTFGVPILYPYGGELYQNKDFSNYTNGYIQNNMNSDKEFNMRNDDDFCLIQ